MNKPLEQLNEEELTMIIAVLENPIVNNIKLNPEKAEERAKVLLKRFKENP